MIMIGQGRRELNAKGGRKDVHVYIRSIRRNEWDVSWPNHERIRIMIQCQTLHIDFLRIKHQ